jgi:hypothetical protein
MLLRFYVLVFAFLSIATFPEATRSDISPVMPRLTLSRSHGMRLQSGCGRLVSLHGRGISEPLRQSAARRTATVLSTSHREPEGSGNSVNTVHLLLAAVTKFGEGCFAMPALLASLLTEKRES